MFPFPTPYLIETTINSTIEKSEPVLCLFQEREVVLKAIRQLLRIKKPSLPGIFYYKSGDRHMPVHFGKTLLNWETQ